MLECLETADGLTELLALAHVIDRGVHQRLHHADCIGAQPRETDVECRLDGGERLAFGVAARLSRYLQVLTQAHKMGKQTISSQELADYTHVNSTQIRRDLSGFGKFGKRGVGYNVESLVSQIRKILRTSGQHNIALFGAGHLGNAIASSDISMTPKTPIEIERRKLPVEWQVAIPSLSLSIETVPLNPRAWMGTSFAYWEGPISFHGSHSGVGYLELTGY